MTALALREDQTAWDANQLAVLRSTGIDEDVTEPELNAFLHECQRRRLDPFTRQIYLLGRWDNQKRRKVYRSQTSIDGFRLIARRAADEAKESIELEDTLWCGPDRKWVDVWLEDEPPAACKFVVLRDGKRFPAVAKYSGYVQLNRDGEPMGLWRKMPDNQISKCAEALALRKAFPEELGSLYTDDEMAQADNPQAAHPATAEVIREEPAAPPAEPDPGWYDSVLERAATVTEDTYKTLWAELGSGQKAGKCTTGQRKEAEALIAARMDDLRSEQSSADAGVVEGVIVTGLAPEDSWYAKVESVISSEDAAAAIADVQHSKSLTVARKDQIIAAIKAREASLLTRTAA